MTESNRLTPADRERIAERVRAFARQTPRMNSAERFTTAERVAHHAIGCDERDLRVSELTEIACTVRLILATTNKETTP